MVITLVTDQFYQEGHGTSISAQRFYEALIKQGHEVRVLAIDDGSHTMCSLKEQNYGKLINRIINSQGFHKAKVDKKMIKQAITGADIVHVYLPFKLGYTTIKLCRELNIPCSAAFHILPENITATLYLNKVSLVNNLIWKKFYNQTYRYLKHIHCPSKMVANKLEKRNFRSYLHVISNGYNEYFYPKTIEKPHVYQDKFIICYIGRFSREKRYDLIIKAVKESKYKDKIQLIFGGKGPIKKQIMKMAKELPNYPVFDFFSKEQLCDLFNYADLYLHPADIEVEGMSCLEAVACGCVPIVSNSLDSATSQFTVSKEHSVFQHGDYKDLAKKIDWWLEHPKEREKHRAEIAKNTEKFSLDKSIKYYNKMFEMTIQDWDSHYDGKKKNQGIAPKIIDNYK